MADRASNASIWEQTTNGSIDRGQLNDIYRARNGRLNLHFDTLIPSSTRYLIRNEINAIDLVFMPR
jgi:hypothetical protein